MGFSVKLAPGVRVRASSRGVRVGVGPRIARVHVGTSGRAGFSSGVGPFSVYTSVGGHKRRGSQSRSTGPSQAALQRQAAAARRAQADADKAREAQRLAEVFHEIRDVHKQEFPPVQRPVAQPPAMPDPAQVRARREHHALQGIGIFKRAERAAARRRAAADAEAELAYLWHQAQAEAARAQAELDRQWALLAGNDPDVVFDTLAEAFADNEAAAVPVGIDGSEVSLVVVCPGESAVPERMPGLTQAGNLTLRKLTKAERSSLYSTLIAGHVLVTLREALAVAPGISAVRVIAVRPSLPDPYGRSRLDCVVAGRWARRALDGVRWQDTDALTILTGTSAELVADLRRNQFMPLDLAREPEIEKVLASIDADELLADQ
jgi:hypothetical protein